MCTIALASRGRLAIELRLPATPKRGSQTGRGGWGLVGGKGLERVGTRAARVWGVAGAMCPACEQQTCSHHGGGDTLDVARRAAVRWRRALAEARRAVGCRRTGAQPGAQPDARGHTAGWRGSRRQATGEQPGAQAGRAVTRQGGGGQLGPAHWRCERRDRVRVGWGRWWVVLCRRPMVGTGAGGCCCARACALGSPSMRGIILSIMHVALTPTPSGLVVSTCTTPRAYGRQTRVRVCAEGAGRWGTPAPAPNGARCCQREFECGKGVLARAVVLARARRGRHTRVDGVNHPTTTTTPLLPLPLPLPLRSSNGAC